MKETDEKKVQNQDEEILNPKEAETVEGGVRTITDLEAVNPSENDEKGEGCNCRCHG